MLAFGSLDIMFSLPFVNAVHVKISITDSLLLQMGPGQSLMLNQGLSLQSSQSVRLIPTGNKVGHATTPINKTVVQFTVD